MAYQVPETQWAQVLHSHDPKGGIEYERIPVQKPGPDEVLVNVKYSGVCHTDIHAVKGDWPLETKLPLVGGHEGAGIVVSRGALVHDIEIGDHVGVKWINGTCLRCSYCEQADEPLCAKALLSGFTVDGTFQQYCVAKAAHVAHIPKNLPLDAAAPIMCAGITVYKGLKESGARPGQSVAIAGAGGGLGCLACQYAKAMGLDIMAIDTGVEKADMTKRLGARAFIDFETSNDLVRDIKGATVDGLGPHAVILIADNERSFQQAVEYVRPRGTVVIIGLPAGAYFRAPVFDIVTKMISIKGSYVGNRRDTEEALDFVSRGQVSATFETVKLSDLQSVYDLMSKGKIIGRYVLDTSAEADLC